MVLVHAGFGIHLDRHGRIIAGPRGIFNPQMTVFIAAVTGSAEIDS